MQDENVLVINLGSTSTKLAFFPSQGKQQELHLSYSREELAAYPTIMDQFEMRLAAVRKFVKEHLADHPLDLIVARGGNCRPLPSGIVEINDDYVFDVRSRKYGEHAVGVSGVIAFELAKEHGCPAIVVDAENADDFIPLARFTGIKGVERLSRTHTLNQKAVARQFALEAGRSYRDVRLVVAHLGGGISVSAHEDGRIIDSNNCLDGDGPFTPERAGTVPTCSMIEMLSSGQYTGSELARRLQTKSGLTDHLGTADAREVERRIGQGDEEARLVYTAMAYQVAKEIGAAAMALSAPADAVLLTGGLARSKLLTDTIELRTRRIAPVKIYPGEFELEAMWQGGLRFLRGEEPARKYAREGAFQ